MVNVGKSTKYGSYGEGMLDPSLQSKFSKARIFAKQQGEHGRNEGWQKDSWPNRLGWTVCEVWIILIP